jgi:hypothetical protein
LEIDAAHTNGGLLVELDLTRRDLTVTSAGETLGRYPLDQVAVSRVGSDRFDLTVGSDELVFTADDAIRFSYEAMPMISSARHQRIPFGAAIRTWLQPRRDASIVEDRSSTPAGRAFTPTETPRSFATLRSRLSGEDLAASDPFFDTAPVPRSTSATDADLPSLPQSDVCVGIRSDGKVCGSAAVSTRGFCYAHDPDRHVERREVQERTTRAADRVRRMASENLDDVVARLERAVAEVHEGKLDPQQAIAMASLAHALVETIELAKSEEAGKHQG